MDALIRVMVGAAALCAASVAFAGPVVIDGDPDEPDIGGGVALGSPEPVISPHSPASQAPGRSSRSVDRIFETKTVTTLTCSMEWSLASKDLSRVKSFKSEDPWIVSFDLSRRLYKIWGNGSNNFLGDVSDVNQESITLVGRLGEEIHLDRTTGKITHVHKDDGFYYLESGNCEKSATRAIELGPPTKF